MKQSFQTVLFELKIVEYFFGVVVKFAQETGRKVHQFENKTLKNK